MNISLKDVKEADQRIKSVEGGVRQTPLDESGVLSERTDTSFLLKGEHLQRTGSFKLRGALNRVLLLNDEERRKGIVASSSGNHGIATAHAARAAGVDVTIYLPDSVSPLKLANMKRLGANTVLVPGVYAKCEKAAHEAVASQGKTFFSPYSHPDVVAGQGTIGLELDSQCPDLAAVFASVGGGGLIGGVGSYLKSLRPEVEIIGCWPENASAMHQCLERGEIFEAEESDTLSDGTAGGIEKGAITFPICQQVIDRHVLVSEAEIASAMRDIAANERFIIEGSAGVAVASALKTASDYRGKKVAVVICGRNIDLETFRTVILDKVI
ncbi:MAG: threonine/serine dehydratase [Gammaproteobacteria bacterium]|nr:threonine/serine dehydratase [Gammaproteobacteria bacterium]